MKKITAFLFVMLCCFALSAQVTSSWNWTKFTDSHFGLEQQQDYVSGAQTLRHPIHFYDSTQVAVDTGYTFYLGKTSAATFPLSSFLLMNPTTRQLQLKSVDSLRIKPVNFTRTSSPSDGQCARWNATSSAWEWFTPATGSTTYTGTTNASGVYTVTYASAYSTTPNVQMSFIGSNPRDVIMLTSSTTTGFTVQVQRRVDVLGLLPSYTNQSGVTCNVLVTQ